MLAGEHVVFRDILRPIQVASHLKPFGISDPIVRVFGGPTSSRRGKEFPDVETYLRR